MASFSFGSMSPLQVDGPLPIIAVLRPARVRSRSFVLPAVLPNGNAERHELPSESFLTRTGWPGVYEMDGAAQTPQDS